MQPLRRLGHAGLDAPDKVGVDGRLLQPLGVHAGLEAADRPVEGALLK
jgi:hypothetical protein